MSKISLHTRTITLNMPVEVIVEDEQDEFGRPFDGGGLVVLVVRQPSIKTTQKMLNDGGNQ